MCFEQVLSGFPTHHPITENELFLLVGSSFCPEAVAGIQRVDGVADGFLGSSLRQRSSSQDIGHGHGFHEKG